MKLGRSLQMSGLIGAGMEVEGTVRFNRLLRVDGVVRGRIESYDTLVVGRSGRVDAEVIVGAMKVYGTVSGRIAVDRLVEIFPGGRVEGELHAAAPAVQISEGGVFEGQLHMTSTEGKAAGREEVNEAVPEAAGGEFPEAGPDAPEAAGEEGSVWVQAGVAPGELPPVGACAADGCQASPSTRSWIEVRVMDNGPGITSEDRDKIFHPFFTTKEHGSGVGLSMAKKIVDSHCGTIAVESPEGGGSTFTIRLPLVQASPEDC